jgi:carbamoyltransferase
MHILGISCYYHDAAAALLRDGRLVAAAQEERFSHRKHDSSYPEGAIAYCLREAGIDGRDLDYAVFYEKPLVKFERILMSSLATFPRSWRLFGESMINWFEKKLWIRSRISRELDLPSERILFVDHHDAHAASAFFTSPFREAALLTVDGVGEWTTTATGTATADWGDGGRNSIDLDQTQRFPHSLGLLYSAFTAFLGFRVNNGEYKVMGMAPYGDPKYTGEIYDRILRTGPGGSFSLNMDYLSYHYSPERSFSRRFTDLFGPPRAPGSEFITPRTNPGEISPESEEARRNQHYADVAASIQRVTEEVLLDMVRALHERTGQENLCMAGGVALNSVANGRIKRETPFSGFFIQPAAGDAGGALGAALYTWHVLLDNSREEVLDHAFWGESYDGARTAEALEGTGLRFREVDHERAVELSRDAILRGSVMALCQGRFEWGPRALGNRSILADPRGAEMKDVINSKIKFREPFRPFAPAVPEESAHRWFEGIGEDEDYRPARFMLTVMPWKESQGEKVAAVNHMGTGRLQTVRRSDNPLYYDIIRSFGEATGVDVLVNTSFNLRGDPIASTPEHALKTFTKSGIDCMYLNGFWVEKA